MSTRKIKEADNIENLCPIPRKKSTTKSASSKIVSNFESASSPSVLPTEILEEMGISMLDSEESSSSAISAIALAVSATNTSDENSNEATPHLSAPMFQHQRATYNAANADTTLEDLMENSNSNNTFNGPDDASLRKGLPKSSSEKRQPQNKKVNFAPAEPGVSNDSNSPSTHKRTRNPLATVTTNNQQKNQQQLPSSLQINVMPSTSRQAMLLKTQHTSVLKSRTPNPSIVPNDAFFLYRTPMMRAHIADGTDHFNKLSDEMMLHIFRLLPKKTLLRIASVCRRFNRCIRDETLWTRLDLGSRTLSAGALEEIITRGIIVLRLAQTEIHEPAFLNQSKFINYENRLQYLDVSLATISKPSLKTLLTNCTQLKKLSLEHIELDSDICIELAKSKHLEALNLAMCSGLDAESVRYVLESLQNLNSLNISWTDLPTDAVSAVVTHITPNIMRLNIAGCRKTMVDSHVAALAKRCPQLIELDLSDCSGLSSDVISIICNFKMLEYLSVSRCYLIPAATLMILKNLPTLTYLDVFGMLSEQAMEILEKSFPKMGINKFIHSSVARPTVGTRRTSIWGLRTRD